MLNILFSFVTLFVTLSLYQSRVPCLSSFYSVDSRPWHLFHLPRASRVRGSSPFTLFVALSFWVSLSFLCAVSFFFSLLWLPYPPSSSLSLLSLFSSTLFCASRVYVPFASLLSFSTPPFLSTSTNPKGGSPFSGLAGLLLLLSFTSSFPFYSTNAVYGFLSFINISNKQRRPAVFNRTTLILY